MRPSSPLGCLPIRQDLRLTRLESGFLHQPPDRKKCQRDRCQPDRGELDQVLPSRFGFVPLVVHRQLPTLACCYWSIALTASRVRNCNTRDLAWGAVSKMGSANPIPDAARWFVAPDGYGICSSANIAQMSSEKSRFRRQSKRHSRLATRSHRRTKGMQACLSQSQAARDASHSNFVRTLRNDSHRRGGAKRQFETMSHFSSGLKRVIFATAAAVLVPRSRS